jgi:hypothetical protein
MSKLRLFAVAAVVAALVAVAALGAGLKWGKDAKGGYAPERIAGWTWDAGVIAQPQPGADPSAGDPSAGDQGGDNQGDDNNQGDNSDSQP